MLSTSSIPGQLLTVFGPPLSIDSCVGAISGVFCFLNHSGQNLLAGTGGKLILSSSKFVKNVTLVVFIF